jgi:hypothetical protein
MVLSTADQSKSKPLKITMLFRTVNHLFQWAIYTMAMLNNQRVYTVYIYIWLVVWNHAIYGKSYVRNNHPNWRTHIFQKGWNHQPVMSYEVLCPNISPMPNLAPWSTGLFCNLGCSILAWCKKTNMQPFDISQSSISFGSLE